MGTHKNFVYLIAELHAIYFPFVMYNKQINPVQFFVNLLWIHFNFFCTTYRELDLWFLLNEAKYDSDKHRQDLKKTGSFF